MTGGLSYRESFLEFWVATAGAVASVRGVILVLKSKLRIWNLITVGRCWLQVEMDTSTILGDRRSLVTARLNHGSLQVKTFQVVTVF